MHSKFYKVKFAVLLTYPAMMSLAGLGEADLLSTDVNSRH